MKITKYNYLSFIIFNLIVSLTIFSKLFAEQDFVWTRKTNMPTRRNSLAVGVVNNKIYAIGGSSASSTVLSTVEEYDPASDTWTTKASMPTARRRLAVGVVNNKIYAIGGDSGLGIWGDEFATVEEYDPATDTWTTKASMPTARQQLTVGVVNNKIYAIGGYGGSFPVEEYNPETNTWTTKGTVFSFDWHAEVVNSKIYVVWGASGGSYSLVYEYDPGTDTKTRKATMPIARAYFTIGTINDKIYTIGGLYFSTVEEYNPATDTWTTKASIPIVTAELSAGVIDNKIYIIGGWCGYTTYSVYEGRLENVPIVGLSQIENMIALGNNLFNPLNGSSCKISFSMPSPGKAEINIYDLRGRIIRNLIDNNYNSGNNWTSWNGKDDDGDIVPPGLYILHYKYPGGKEVRKIGVER